MASTVVKVGVGDGVVIGRRGNGLKPLNKQASCSRLVVRACATSSSNGSGESDSDKMSVGSSPWTINRRNVMSLSVLVAFNSDSALAVTQALLAGRIPGLSSPDQNGLRTYRRPDEKSGGHGVGWSPMTPYSFKVPEDWNEVPVSIADLGGTEIDLRFSSPEEGNISVVVAPVKRFSDTIEDNATIEEIGPPDKVIYAFGPELTGNSVEAAVKDMEVKNYDGRTYYQYELEPHILITATAAGNRLYLMTVNANGRQWRKHAGELRNIQDSFRVG